MIQRSQIDQLCQKIVQYFNPDRIILFGSYGYGNPTEDSDVDILVILPASEHNARKVWEILKKTNPTFPVDILVKTPTQINERLAWNDWFIREIIEKGIPLYEAHHKRVD